jgi:dTDP-4-amino-4,6-dideoxygalactose transaminase
MGMSPESLRSFLKEMTFFDDGLCKNKLTGRRISAVVPMHTFGFACRIKEIQDICADFNIPLVEDSAESIGTWVGNKHTGTFGKLGVFSLNGNKTITSGGGGAIVTNDQNLAKQLKHMTTTAKLPHKWEYVHDMIGYNYRMPNINAALACAQLEELDNMLNAKRKLSNLYAEYFGKTDISYFNEVEDTKANFWLNTVVLPNIEMRDYFLEETNSSGVMTRPIWRLLNDLNMFKECQTHKLENSNWLVDRVVNLPSSVNFRIKDEG